jgi:hypothetical protein
MFRQHTPRMHPHIHMPERLLLWLGLGALGIVVAVIAVQYIRVQPVTAPEPTLPRPAVSNPYDGSAYVPYLTKRPAVNGPYDGSAYVPYLTERAASLSLEYGPRFNPGTGTVYNGKSYGGVTAP